MRTLVAACLGLALAAATVAAAPQAAQAGVAAIQAERDAVARGLEAQFQVALIRERKLADDREQRLIGGAESRLAKARAEAESARGEAHATKTRLMTASAELEAARADYAKLAGDIALHDATAKAEIEAYRAEANGLAAQATPERLAALQRFADGDRQGAWPILEALRMAEDKAMESAANAHRAVRWRQDAELRKIMQDHGEATTADVLALWDKAGELDPSDVWTHVQRSRLAVNIGDLPRASAAAEAAVAAAKSDNDNDIALAYDERGMDLRLASDVDGARKAYQVAIAADRRQLAQKPDSVERQRSISYDLWAIAEIQRSQNDLAGALDNYRQALDVSRKALSVDPNSTLARYDVAADEERIAGILEQQDDFAAARVAMEDAVNLDRITYGADQKSIDAEIYLSYHLSQLGQAQVLQGDNAAARKSYQESLVLARRLSAQDPTSSYGLGYVPVALGGLGRLSFYDNDLDGALSAFQESAEVLRRLAAGAPTMTYRRQELAIALSEVGDVFAEKRKLPEATSAYKEALDITRDLRAKDSATPYRAMMVAHMLISLGDVASLGGDAEAATQSYQEALDIDRPQMKDSKDQSLRSDMGFALSGLGDARLAKGDRTGALELHRQGLKLFQAVAVARPGLVDDQVNVGIELSKLAAIPGSGVTWSEVVKAFENVKTRGALPPVNQHYLDEARRKAAA